MVNSMESDKGMIIMEFSNRIKWVRNGHFFMNCIIILFLSMVISATTNQICNRFEARAFLERAQYLPLIPWQVTLFCILLLIFFIISNIIKDKFKQSNIFLIGILCLCDLIIGFTISYYLNFSYNGIILLIIANMILYVKDLRLRILFIIISLIAYSFFDFNVISVKINIFSINEYIDFYPSSKRLYIYSIKNLLTSLNEVIFYTFIFVLLQEEIVENRNIKKLNKELEITANELILANEKLEEYAKESEEIAKMKERNRLAREIHDILGHTLTSVTMGIEGCLALLPENLEKGLIQLKKILKISKKGLYEVRRSVRELKVDTLQKDTLIVLLQNLSNDINDCTDTKININITGEPMKLKDDEEQTIFRIIQESITNSMRHGSANNVKVDLTFDYYRINILIKDDGKGCDNIKAGFGLTHMIERVNILKGNIEFLSKDDGFVTEVSIPIRWGDAYD